MRTKSTEEGSPQVVELLLTAGIMAAEQVEEVRNMARETGMSVGKMLAMSGFVKKETLAIAIEADKLLKESDWDKNLLALAVSQAHSQGTDLQSQLATMSQSGLTAVPVKPRVATNLGEFFVAAGLLTQAELQSYQATVNETGLPLGRVISHAGVVKMELVLAALAAQIYERSGLVDKATATSILRTAGGRGIAFEQAMQQLGIQVSTDMPDLRLAELLIQAGLANAAAVTSALELSLIRNTPVGEELSAMGQIQQNVLEHTLYVHNLVGKGRLAGEHAAASLRRIALNGENPDIALGEIAAMVLSPDDFDDLDRILSASDVVNDMDLVPVRVGLRDNAPFIEYLGALASGKIIDDTAALRAARLLYLVRMEAVDDDEAVQIMRRATREDTTIDEALAALRSR